MIDRCAAFAAGFRRQADWCHRLGSPFSGVVLEEAAADVAGGHDVVARFMPWWPGETEEDFTADAVALRFLGCAHALALSGRSRALQARFPSCEGAASGKDGDARGVWALAVAAMDADADYARAFLRRPPQTNEVGRAGALMPGLLELAAQTGMPVRLLEIGASAGLLQGLDGFFYRLGRAQWGDPGAPCRLAPDWPKAAVPPVGAALTIAARAACDVTPVDLWDPEEVLRLRSYVWADQAARLARLDGALEIARERGVQVAAASADVWLAEQLAPAGPPGTVTCVMHSVMWQYMPADVRARAQAAIMDAGARATADAPFAWLRLEPAERDKPMQVVLAIWRGGAPEVRLLARAQPHGASVAWAGWEAGAVLAGPEITQEF